MAWVDEVAVVVEVEDEDEVAAKPIIQMFLLSTTVPLTGRHTNRWTVRTLLPRERSSAAPTKYRRLRLELILSLFLPLESCRIRSLLICHKWPEQQSRHTVLPRQEQEQKQSLYSRSKFRHSSRKRLWRFRSCHAAFRTRIRRWCGWWPRPWRMEPDCKCYARAWAW